MDINIEVTERKIEELFSQLKIIRNGHCYNNRVVKEIIKRNLSLLKSRIFMHLIKTKATIEHFTIDDFFNLAADIMQTDSLTDILSKILCPVCGEYVEIKIDNNSIMFESKCKLAGVIKPVEFEINIPSGEIAYSDNLGLLHDLYDHYSIEDVNGSNLTSIRAASKGIATGFVGNSCPSIIRIGKDKYAITDVRSIYLDEMTDFEKMVFGKFIPPGKNKLEKIGSICTDLWWYQIADAELTKSFNKCKIEGVFKTTPGKYLFKHDNNFFKNALLRRKVKGYSRIFATFELKTE